MQKVLSVYTEKTRYGKRETGLNEVNELLEKGWHVVNVSPMSGAGTGNDLDAIILGSIFVLSDEKEDQKLYSI